jgi:hypothetical protein
MTSQKPTTAVSSDGALSTSSRGATAAIDNARVRMPMRVQDDALHVGVDENHNDSLNYALFIF